MELIQTTPELAFSILKVGNRKIKATKGNGIFTVNSMNINNMTFRLSFMKGGETQCNCEDYVFYIQVPKNSKQVY